MSYSFRRSARVTACTALFVVANCFGAAYAQDSMQTGDGLLMIKAAMPESAKVGQSFNYNIEVMNTSDNVVLHDIKLKQRKTAGFSIESVSMQGQSSDQSEQGDQSNQGDQSEQSSGQNQATSEKQNGDQSGSDSKSSKNQMMISKLNPGESRTFVVKASADEEGELRNCLEIANYTPALCLTSQIVKPDLELTKTAPKKTNRCNLIELTYRVKNGGSGDVGRFTITDSLGDGLATIEGSSELSFPVDGLDAGETREFVARVYAKKTGRFSSRAVAKAENSDLESRSKETTTNVVAADLVADVKGPKRIYGDGMATFTATITNDGNIAADSVNVTVSWPSQANLADMSEYEKSMNESSGQSGKQNGGQPTMANKQDSSDQGGSSDASGQSGSDKDMQSDSFVIDRLKAGETAEFTYAIRTDNLQELPTKVEARYVCTVDAAEDQAESTSKVTAMAMTTLKIVRLPALQLAVVDDEDPVQDGTKVQYTITVWNEGDATDENVQLVAKLPDNLKFDAADGPTEVNSEGNAVEFAPIKTMRPGDRAEFTVTAKPTGTGNVRFEAALTSKMLQSEVISEEPTRLFDSSNN